MLLYNKVTHKPILFTSVDFGLPNELCGRGFEDFIYYNEKKKKNLSFIEFMNVFAELSHQFFVFKPQPKIAVKNKLICPSSFSPSLVKKKGSLDFIQFTQ